MWSRLVIVVMFSTVAALVVGCGSSSDDLAQAAFVAGRASTTTQPVQSTSTTTTTSSTTTAPTTTSVPTTITTASSLLDALEIDGAPVIEFSVEADPALADQITQDELVDFVVDTLSDERSWTSQGVGFRLLDEGGDFTITVASPDRVDRLCRPLRTNGYFSCAANGWVVFNSDRWFGATDSWPSDLDTYRRYLVNHEVGHYILPPGHPGCPGEGELAPVMMQQTKGLNGCLPNGWVDPDAGSVPSRRAGTAGTLDQSPASWHPFRK